MKINSPQNAFRQKLPAMLLAIALLVSAAFGQQQAVAPGASTAMLSAAERDASALLKVETIREVTTALSAPEMQGRGTMQPGGDKAAKYIADRFAKLGLKPLGEKNSYMQPIKFQERVFMPETSLKVGDDSFKLGTDFYIDPPYTGDENLSGEVVFVAYGIVSTLRGRNDLAGIDLQDKIVMLLEGPPKGYDKATWEDPDNFTTIMVNLFSRGVAGIMYVSNGKEEQPFGEIADYYSRRRILLADEKDYDWPDEYPPYISASYQAVEKMFNASGMTYAQALAKADSNNFAPISLKKSARFILKMKNSKGVSSNVVGLLEGSDPKLKDEALVYSAHYDAYGMDASGRIYPGAADNALGVAEMFAAAEVLTKTKPRRSIIFLAVTGEEYGGFGSDYWVKHPTWNIKKVAANLNFDGMGTEVYGPVKTLVGYGAEHSSLGTLLTEVAAANDLKIIPDPRPEEKSFTRSDHYYFVKKGVPALMVLGAPEGETSKWIERMKAWEKSDYHQPTDTIRADWSWEGARMMAVLGLIMGMRIADSAQMPAWVQTSRYNRERGTNKPVDEP